MQVVYHGHPANQAAMAAAAIHLGMLPEDRLPSTGELAQFLQLHAAAVDQSTRFPVLQGVDAKDCGVSALGMGGDPRLVARVLSNFAQVFGISDRELRVVEAGRPVGFCPSIAVRVMGWLGWWRMQAMLTVHLLRREYFWIVDQVGEARAWMERAPQNPDGLDLLGGLKDNYGEQEGEANFDSPSWSPGGGS